MADLVVSLVTHNESGDAGLFLESLARQTFRDFRVEATDNNSEDGTRSVLKTWERLASIPIRVHASRENLGFTGGHNAGISRALEHGAKWVLVANADIVLADDFLERLLEEASAPKHNDAASFTGKVLRATGPDLTPSSVIDTAGIWMTRNGRHFDIGGGCLDRGQFDRPAAVFGVSGCLALYRLSALAESRISTGFFDDDFFIYREDVDLAWRLRGMGFSARFLPGALAWHRRRNLPERRRSMSPAANMHSVKNRFLLRINNAGKEHFLSTFPGTFARDLLVVGASMTVERTSRRALTWLLANRERLLLKREEIQRKRRVSDHGLLSWFTRLEKDASRPLS